MSHFFHSSPKFWSFLKMESIWWLQSLIDKRNQCSKFYHSIWNQLEPEEEQVHENLRRDLLINISLFLFNLSLVKKENKDVLFVASQWEKKRSESRYERIECDFDLCVTDCFKQYHTLINF